MYNTKEQKSARMQKWEREVQMYSIIINHFLEIIVFANGNI